MESDASNDYFIENPTKGRPMAQDDIDRFIAELRSEADAADFSDLSEPAVAWGSRPSVLDRLRARAAAVAAAVLVTFGGLGGVAYAADGAAPGDLLYGLDRALEVVGIGHGGSAERLEEVETLVANGHADRGLEHAITLVENDSSAQAALLAAAERIGGLDVAATHEGVADLLTYLSENSGSVDGSEVAGMARAIGGKGEPGPPEGVEPGPPEGVTPGPPEGVEPGPPEGVEPGPPEGVTPGPPEGVTPGPPEGVTPGPPEGVTPGPPPGTTP